MFLLRLLGLEGDEGERPAPDASSKADLKEIADALDRLEPERARYVAAFAYILSRAVLAGREVRPESVDAMVRILSEKADLPEDQARLVARIAKAENRRTGHTDNFLVTREFNQLATRQQKLYLLECLFAVTAADHEISAAEDHEIRQIARELRLERDDFIRVRSRYREHLSFLKKEEDSR